MSKASPTTYKIGSIGEFAAWTKEVVRDPAATHGAQKKWFDRKETAEHAAARVANDFADPSQRRKCLLACVARAKANARRKGLVFDLTPEFVETIWNDGLCAVTGVQFNLKEYPNAFVTHPFAPSIDRMLSAGGYTRDNVRLVCVAVNFGLGQYGDEVFLKLAEGAVEHQRQVAALAWQADWEAAYRERIAAAEALLAIAPENEQAKQRQRIAGLKRALTLGPSGLRAAAAKAKVNRQRAPV